MPVVSKELDPMSRRQIGLRIHPDVRKGLKAAAALQGVTMEDLLHRILVRELHRFDLLPDHLRREG